MLENRKNVRKIVNKILIVLMAIMITLGVYIKVRYSRTKDIEIETMAAQSLEHVRSSARIAATNPASTSLTSTMLAAVDITQGTIKPTYKPEWEIVKKADGSKDITVDTGAKTLTVKIKGTASKSEVLDTDASGNTTAEIDYNSNVTSSLTADKIQVFIDDVDVTDETRPEVAVTPNATADPTISTTPVAEIVHTITLSNMVEAMRAAGLYKEWSGNITLKIAGRGEDEETYDANVLVDEYGNQNMMESDEGQANDATWIDIVFEEAEVKNANAQGVLFADFIKPEFTYLSSETTIGSGPTGNETVTVVFYGADKYFNSESLTAEDLIIKVDGEVPAWKTKTEDLNGNGQLDEGEDLDGDGELDTQIPNRTLISEDVKETVNGVANTVVGKKYTLTITGLDLGGAFDYSGKITIEIPPDKITDKSNNANERTVFAIGLNENDGNPNTEEEVEGEGIVVDVVDPIWIVQNKTVSTAADGTTNAVMDLIATDKYFKESTLSTSNLQVNVGGINLINDLNVTLSETPTPVDVTINASGEYVVTTAADAATANGAKYTFTLTNFEETFAEFLQARANNERKYREFSGDVEIVIPEATATDDSANTNEELTIDLGIIDTLKPEIVKVSSSVDDTNKKYTIVFDITDKYFASSTISATDTSMIDVLIDGEEADSITKPATAEEQANNKDKIFKEITNIEELKATVDGVADQLVGYRYTLVLSDFDDPRTTIDYTREYTDWSGTVAIRIDADTAKDDSNTGNETRTLTADYTDTNATVQDYVDFIKPDVTYKFTSSDINHNGKTFSMTFDVTDKYFASTTLTKEQLLEALIIKIDGEVPDWTKVTKALAEENITNTVNPGTAYEETKVIGKRYTLTLEHLEQLQIQEGDKYLDYSGVITVEIPAGLVKDTELKDASENHITGGNTNDLTVITSGINIPGGDVDDAVIVDVVDPLWERVSSKAYAFTPNTIDTTKTAAQITIRGTDKYLSDSTLTINDITAYVDGAEAYKNGAAVITGVSMSLSDPTPLTETRSVNGTSVEKQYGVEYTITITGFAETANQVKIQIAEDAISDEEDATGETRGNKLTDLIIYNVLKITNTETTATSAFLGQSTATTLYPAGATVTTPIARQDIEKVVFVDNLETIIGEGIPRVWNTDAKTWTIEDGVQTIWDVSARGDDSILAWIMKNADGTEATAPYTVYIGSAYEIFANQDSSYLFSDIGNSKNSAVTATATETIKDFRLVNVNSVTNMSYMFDYTGYTAMTSLDLGANFNTQNVENMYAMFRSTGYTAMTNIYFGTTTGIEEGVITLPDNFNTSKVKDMTQMFDNFGHGNVKELNLGNSFNTSLVETMQAMFRRCGYTSMETLDLGQNFDTRNVNDMSEMFRYCGYKEMTALDLGELFDTSNVIDMEYMFQYCGNDSMQTLNLGNKFNTSKVTNMNQMFRDCGYGALQSLDLGDLFYTTSATTMNTMFSNVRRRGNDNSGLRPSIHKNS